MNYPDVSATGTSAAWTAREEHDRHWLPLHPYAEEDGDEPTADDQPVERPATADSSQRDVPGGPPERPVP